MVFLTMVAMLTLVLVAGSWWRVRRESIRRQPFRFDYDSRHPQP